MSRRVVAKGPFLLRLIEETDEENIPEAMVIDGMIAITDSAGGTISLSHEEFLNLIFIQGPRILEGIGN